MLAGFGVLIQIIFSSRTTIKSTVLNYISLSFCLKKLETFEPSMLTKRENIREQEKRKTQKGKETI